jgi:hypothetical protein
MRRRNARIVIGVAGLIGAIPLAACVGRGSQPAAAPSSQVGDTARAMVLTEADLRQNDRSLLDILQHRLPNMQVWRNTGCPEVYLRGRSTIVTSSDPAIYVNGTRAANTCVLDMISTFDLSEVEVYPSGMSGRPGYLNNPNGLILIFTVRDKP